MCPHGKKTSTSFPVLQLPHYIFGFHSLYFMQAISRSSPLSSKPSDPYYSVFILALVRSTSAFADASYDSILLYASYATCNLDCAWASAI